MKKSLLAMAAFAACAMSANAIDYYAIGGSIGWNLQDPSGHFEETGTPGVYELKYDGTFLGDFKINDGTWSNDAANFGSNGSALVVGEPYYYGVGGSTGNIAIDGGSVLNPTLTLNTNDGTLTIVGETQEIEYSYGIHGWIFTGDSETWETNEMVESDGNWVVTADIVPGEFGIKVMDHNSGQQVADPEGSNWYWSPTGETTADASLPVVKKSGSNGVNWTSTLEGSYTFSFNLDAMTLIIASPSVWNDITADENATFAIYTIDGNLVKAAANMSDVENLENGMYIVNGQKLMIRK